MLDSALAYKANFKRLKRVNGKYNFSLPSAHDWQFAQLAREKLNIFYDVTLMFSRRDFPCNSLDPYNVYLFI